MDFTYLVRHLVGVLGVVVVSCVAAPLSAQSQECHCDTPWEPHLMVSYDFETSSCVRHYNNDYYAYETCVRNLGRRNMPFDWYIPGPHSRILAGMTLPSVRLHTTDESLYRQDGCLQFGNSHTSHNARFEPHSSDKARLREEAKGCAALVGRSLLRASIGIVIQESAQGDGYDRRHLSDIPPLDRLQLSVFAPTEAQLPDETMIRIDATVRWARDGDRLMHSLALQASPHGEDFRPDLIRVVPQSGWLWEAYLSTYPDDVDSRGLRIFDGVRSYSLDVATGEVLSFRNVRFDIFEVDGERVASLIVPFWGSW